ncbi:MAG: AAA family ATPase [Aquificaceae bacterium]
MIIVVMGLSGSGKSFLASILHEYFGFEWIRSDQVRKELAGVAPTQRLKLPYGEGIYTEEWTRRVYEEMVRRAKQKEWKNIVLDATFLEGWQRELVRKNFPNAVFILAQAEEEEILKRLKSRQDISDADIEIYLRQKEKFSPPDYAIRINTQKTLEELRVELEQLLQSYGYRNTP